MDTVEEKPSHSVLGVGGGDEAENTLAGGFKLKEELCELSRVLPFRSQEGREKATETALWIAVSAFKVF